VNLYPIVWSVDGHHLETLVQQIFPSTPTRVERVLEGVSTNVYRIIYQQETFYLRVLPEEGASFVPEAAVHSQLRQLDIKVPEVIYIEPRNDLLQRSIMVTRAVKGQPISQSQSLSQEELKAILREAGRDLARINSLAVKGFGWIRRDRSTFSLEAQWPTYRLFMLEFWKADLAYLASSTLSSLEVAQLERVLSYYNAWLNSEQAYLGHGDFDTTQIYQEGGRYTGIIDFGEIRGTDGWYDLGHFHIRDGELLPMQLEPYLVHGYEEVATLPQHYEHHIRFTSVLINVRILARSLQKRPPNRHTRHQLDVLREDLALLQ
jgi:aminoglycoside phosphotransferase (APT) family kinase protein